MCGKKSLPRFWRQPSIYTLEHNNSEAWKRIVTYKSFCKHWCLALDASFSCNLIQIIWDSRHFRIRCIRPWWNEEQKVGKKKKLHYTRMAVLQSFNIALEKEGKKKRKKELSQHGVFVVGHPAKYYPRQTGLNFVERTDHVAVLVV